jgi:cell division protein FtsI (penicillin-binding protein 3)
MPKKNDHGQYVNWAKTSLPWMSIGYETQIPPISTLTFYNAIANGGCMMRPRFVKQVVKNGEVLMDFPPEIMRKQICKNQDAERDTNHSGTCGQPRTGPQGRVADLQSGR